MADLLIWTPDPHTERHPCGHWSRTSGLAEALGAEIVNSEATFDVAAPDAALIVMDTYPAGFYGEMGARVSRAQANGTKLVWMRRYCARVIRPPTVDFDLVFTPGPYEGGDGVTLGGPVLPTPVPADCEPVDVLVVCATMPSAGPIWAQAANALLLAGFSVRVMTPKGLRGVPQEVQVSGRAIDYMHAAKVIVGGGGWSLYEGLWSGRPYVVRQIADDQPWRIERAIAAGEHLVITSDRTVVDKVIEALRWAPEAPRPGSADMAASLIRGLLDG